MRGSLSRSQIEKLGIRLVQDEQPADEDLDLLHQLLMDYSEVLGDAIALVSGELGISPSSRVKSTGTILEKLERYGGSWLKSIQDLAGMRIVGAFDRNGQDALVEQVVGLFGRERRVPKIVDRRLNPMYGYAAVHVIAFPDGVPIEIQVRTRWQHEWAELFEKLADRVGRGIRYGEPPSHWRTPDELKDEAPAARTLYELSYSLRVAVVDQAVTLAALIASVEKAEVAAPDIAQLDRYRQRVREGLDRVQQNLGRL